MRIGAVCFLGVGVAASACGGTAPDPSSPTTGPVSVGPPPRLVKPTRPRTVEDVTVDYGSLPRLVPIGLGPNPKGPFFKKRSDGVYELHTPGDILAEIEVGTAVFFSVPNGPVDDVGSAYSLVSAGAQLCTDHTAPMRAVWIGFSPKEKRPGSLEFFRYEGSFDPVACMATPVHAWHVRAPAILEGSLYAFRAANAEEEKLEVIGPRSIWLGSSGPTAEQHIPLAQPFSRVVVPISRGSTGTAVLDVAGDDLKDFRGASLPPLADAKVVAFSFDVVWAASDPLPTAVASMAALPGLPEELTPPAEAAKYEFQANIDE